MTARGSSAVHPVVVSPTGTFGSTRSSGSDHLAGYCGADILSAIDGAAIDRPFDDFSLGASAIEETGFGSEDEAASRSSIRDRSKDTGELVPMNPTCRNPKSAPRSGDADRSPSTPTTCGTRPPQYRRAGTILLEHDAEQPDRVRSTYFKTEGADRRTAQEHRAHITTVKAAESG
jgi:hypothetical protein